MMWKGEHDDMREIMKALWNWQKLQNNKTIIMIIFINFRCWVSRIDSGQLYNTCCIK